MTERKKFRRESEETRRDQLMSAAIDIIAEGGLKGATVREIAARAGVTQGLIRHYFDGMDDLKREAYRAFMSRLTEANLEAAAPGEADGEKRLAYFVAAALRPPIMSERQISVWAAFLNMSRLEPDYHDIHTETYLAYRNQLQEIVASLPGQGDPAHARRTAIAINGLLDGLWLEGSFAGNKFESDELVAIALDAVGKMLGRDLLKHLPSSATLEQEPSDHALC